MAQKAVKVGQRFERLGRWQQVWEVEAITEGTGRVANVALREVKDPTNRFTLAPSALLDLSRFRLIGQVDPQPPTQPAARPVRRSSRSSRKPSPESLLGQRIITMPRRRLETSMMIETRSPAGYVVICKDHVEDHKFVAKNPGAELTCPHCGNQASSMALLLDYLGAAPPWRQINAPSRRQTTGRPSQADARQSRPEVVAERPNRPLARILARSRKRQTA